MFRKLHLNQTVNLTEPLAETKLTIIACLEQSKQNTNKTKYVPPLPPTGAQTTGQPRPAKDSEEIGQH